jgi:hypothetical protein
MKAQNELFAQLELALNDLRKSSAPLAGEFAFRNLNKEIFSGFLLKLSVNNIGRLSLWVGSNDIVSVERVIWESRGIRATQSPDGSGTTNSWIVVETEGLYTDGIFTSLATSICGKCIDTKSTKRGTISGALDEWRELFLSNADGLNVNELAGLLGELITLEEIAQKHGSNALEFWHGFEGERHDFCGSEIAIETKTKTTASADITINGIRQLETPGDGQLALRVIRIEATTSEELSLPGMVQRLRTLGVNQGRLEEGMLKAKASPQQITTATRYFRLLDKTAYIVRDGFPRIVPASFDGKQSPPGVSNLKYQINIGHAENFRLSETEFNNLIDQLKQ